VTRFLLDTHALLWALGDPDLLTPMARDALSDPANEVFVSAASAWEMAIKVGLGKLRVPDDLEDQLRISGFVALPVDVGVAFAVRLLPPHHRDPFDRLLVAQAQRDQLTLVTRDASIRQYSVRVLEA
jgi:PIN domain nuclease of toxin-antitoxin system